MIRKVISIFTSILLILVIYFQDYLYNKYWILSGGILFILSIGVILVVLLNIKKDKYALYISVIAIFIGFSILIVQKMELFKSEIVIKAVLVDDLSYLELTLRKNNTFDLLPVTFLGRTETFSGRYKICDDKIIFLDRPYDNNFIGDTVYIVDNKIILRYDSKGKPDTTFANFFTIDKYEIQ